MQSTRSGSFRGQTSSCLKVLRSCARHESSPSFTSNRSSSCGQTSSYRLLLLVSKNLYGHSNGARDWLSGLLGFGCGRILTLRLERCMDISNSQSISFRRKAYAGDTWGTSRESSPASATKRCSAELLLAGSSQRLQRATYHVEGVVAFAEY